MSVPLDIIPLMDERAEHAQTMARYRKLALEELEHIREWQERVNTSAPQATKPDKASPTAAASVAPNISQSTIDAFPTTPRPQHLQTDNLLPDIPAESTPKKTTLKWKGIFQRSANKKRTDDFGETMRKIIGEDGIVRPQEDVEDIWDAYLRDITALPPMPSSSRTRM
ncbi:hypothetical protein N0V90_005092 [Kalmusia sp. IMI 367209]|nr:hypothetical protein N0V90_005092 [Kalmusia sp. IMI 367209]